MNKRLWLTASYVGYFLIGLISVVLSPSLPFMIKDFSISLGTAGAVFTAQAGGLFFGVLIGGILADILGKKPLIVLGCLVLGLTMAAIAATSSWYLALLFFVLNGIAGGFLNTLLNIIVVEVSGTRQGAAMNALHGIYGLGSLIGPVAVGLVLTWQFGWRLAFYGSAVLWILYLLFVLSLSSPDTEKKAAAAGIKEIPVRSFLFHPVFLLLFLVSFIYNGSATSLVGWINTHLNEMQFSAILGSSMVTIFYIGLTLGRFLCGYFSDRVGFSLTILVCSLGSLLFYPLGIYFSQPVLISIGVFLSGFFFSGLFPTALAYANRLFPSSTGTITGTLSTAMSLGAMIIPWLVGLLADGAGFQAGLSLGYALLFILAAAAIRLYVLEKKKTGSSIPQETVRSLSEQ
ncbi:MAG: MFS transporter [Caldicoprobacterales bacterium]|jgi:MFS family permease|nr:MFS transporter [Clostridiales bacterium]